MFSALRIGIAGAALAAVLTFPLPAMAGASPTMTLVCSGIAAALAFVIGSGMDLAEQRRAAQQRRLFERLRRYNTMPSNN